MRSCDRQWSFSLLPTFATYVPLGRAGWRPLFFTFVAAAAGFLFTPTLGALETDFRFTIKCFDLLPHAQREVDPSAHGSEQQSDAPIVEVPTSLGFHDLALVRVSFEAQARALAEERLVRQLATSEPSGDTLLHGRVRVLGGSLRLAHGAEERADAAVHDRADHGRLGHAAAARRRLARRLM